MPGFRDAKTTSFGRRQDVWTGSSIAGWKALKLPNIDSDADGSTAFTTPSPKSRRGFVGLRHHRTSHMQGYERDPARYASAPKGIGSHRYSVTRICWPEPEFSHLLTK